VNSNIGKSVTHHNHTKEVTIWFLNLPIDNKKHKVGSLNLRPHKAQLEDQKKLKVI
jgi:hypothetical protein